MNENFIFFNQTLFLCVQVLRTDDGLEAIIFTAQGDMRQVYIYHTWSIHSNVGLSIEIFDAEICNCVFSRLSTTYNPHMLVLVM